MAKAEAETADRRPRGTLQLIRAFFSAAEAVPAALRGKVAAAAISEIRDQMKTRRWAAASRQAAARKAAVAPAKARGRPKAAAAKADAPARRGRKPRVQQEQADAGAAAD